VIENLFLLGSYFVVVMSAVTAAGYWLLNRGPIVSSSSGREALAKTLRELGGYLPDANPKPATLRNKLIAAGYRTPESLSIYNGIVFAAMGLLAGVFGLATLITGRGITDAILSAVCGIGIGFFLPKFVLNHRAHARIQRLGQGLPTAIDLLVLSLEAGQTMDAAIVDASRELRRPYPDLADEFHNVCLALGAGASRSELFRDMAARSGERELQKLANLMTDSDRLGVSIAPALRNHARYLRIRRRQTAQESARKVGAKLVFPIFFLIFPSILLVTLGPALIQLTGLLSAMSN
jgi:tight adherence protein C